MSGTTTKCSGSPILILWVHLATVFLNILSVSHLKPRLRYVGVIPRFERNHFRVISMTYLNPQSASLNDDITRFASVDPNRYVSFLVVLNF